MSAENASGDRAPRGGEARKTEGRERYDPPGRDDRSAGGEALADAGRAGLAGGPGAMSLIGPAGDAACAGACAPSSAPSRASAPETASAPCLAASGGLGGDGGAWFYGRVPEGRVAALDGLRGLFLLLFVLYSFWAQFDPAKIGRIASTHAQALLAVMDALMAPCLASREIACVLAGFFLARVDPSASPWPWLRRRAARLFPVTLAVMVPVLAYTGADLGRVLACLAFLGAPEGGPRFTELLFPVVWGGALWVLVSHAAKRLDFALRLGAFVGCMVLAWSFADAFGFAPGQPAEPAQAAFGRAGADPGLVAMGLAFGLAAGRWGGELSPPLRNVGAGIWLGLFAVLAVLEPLLGDAALLPARQAALTLAVVRLAHHPGDRAAMLLSRPGFRFFGVTALSVFLVHSTWGMRLSRSLLQGEMGSLSSIALHFVLSLALATASGAFFRRFFERPALLRKAPPAAKDDGSHIQGACV